jgi:hypothetical protein
MPCKEGHLLVDGSNKKADIDYLFEQGEVFNYTLDSISIYQVTTKMQVSFLTQLQDIYI